MNLYVNDEPDCLGSSYALYLGPHECENLPDSMNDKTSSVKIEPEACFRLCEHEGCAGECKKFTEDTPFLDDYNDKISSAQRCI